MYPVRESAGQTVVHLTEVIGHQLAGHLLHLPHLSPATHSKTTVLHQLEADGRLPGPRGSEDDQAPGVCQHVLHLGPEPTPPHEQRTGLSLRHLVEYRLEEPLNRSVLSELHRAFRSPAKRHSASGHIGHGVSS